MMQTRVIYLVLFVLLALTSASFRGVLAQSFLDQERIEHVLSSYREENIDFLPDVRYSYYVYYDSTGSRIMARNMLYKDLGEGDQVLGQERAILVELLNRIVLEDLQIGDTLVVPTTYELDFRAYSPFPRDYEGASEFDKLFIIDKSIQAFAAYEFGKLARWGIVNTGGSETRTPAGRFNFNWKEEFRVSELSPDEEPWDMYWVFNFHDERGMHVHQYQFPTGGPTSHGCVRLIDADARWIYTWADTWKTKGGGTGYETSGKPIIRQGTTVLVIGEEPEGDPVVFELFPSYPLLKRIELPEHPFDVPPGTAQQKQFDRLHARRTASK